MRTMKGLKRILASALLLTGIACSAGCAEEAEKTEEAEKPQAAEPLVVDYTPEAEKNCVTPPFWVVEDKQTGAQIFLLGSMHAGKADVKYPGYVLDALYNSSWAAPELDTEAFAEDFALQIKCTRYLTLNGITAEDCIGGSYSETLDFFKDKGIYQAGIENMIPFYWASAANSLIISQSGLDANLGTEPVLLKAAKEAGIEIREVEGAESQYKMMSEIPMSVQLETLSQAVGDENIAFQADAVKELYEAWSRFDEDYLKGLAVYDPESVDEPDDWQAYYDMMYTDRQRLMSDFIIEALRSGELGFVFVGTLHYYAEPSIISMLEEAGYMVNKICPDISAETGTAPAA